MTEVAPTPEETKWASFIMNEQRHKRPVSAEDRTKAGQIMGQLRRAQGRTGGGAPKPKASPLVVARAIKDIDAKVAEAQGINASREGDVVPPPAPPVERIPTAEEAFQASGVRLIEDMDRALEALRQECEALANRMAETRGKLSALGARREAILKAIDAFNEVGR